MTERYLPTRFVFHGDRNACQQLVGEAKRILSQLKGMGEAKSATEGFTRDLPGGSKIKIDSSVKGLDIIHIWVEKSIKKQKIWKEEFVQDFTPIPVPEMYVANTDQPFAWRIGNINFDTLFFSKADLLYLSLDPALDTMEVIVSGALQAMPTQYFADEKPLTRWDNCCNKHFYEDSGYQETYNDTGYLPEQFRAYTDCLFYSGPSLTLEEYNRLIEMGIVPWQSHCTYSTGTLLTLYQCFHSNTATSACGPKNLSDYDPSEKGYPNSFSVHKRLITYTYSFLWTYKGKDKNGIELPFSWLSGTETGFNINHYERWGNITSEHYNDVRVTDADSSYLSTPDVLRSAYNIETGDCALIVERITDIAFRSISWTNPDTAEGNPYETQITKNPYQCTVSLWCNNREYEIWKSPPITEGSYLNYCRDAKIYQYGNELIVVFAVICGKIESNYDNCVTIYGMLYREELHLSERYASNVDPLGGMYPAHEWETSLEGMQAYGRGFIHAALLRGVREEINDYNK